MTKNDSSTTFRSSKSGLLIVLAVIVIGAGLGAFYVVSEMSVSSSTTNYDVVGSVTVYGQASGFPCAALGLPCAHPTNQSSISASLTLFEGKYYYVSNITANNVVYTVWYDNSTYYCVSPKSQGVNTCPP